ncbi:condensation domain-containing protein [Actinokineospora cianjurensis]|uniref:Condensation domain-containing protein n=1 Tax=Actinokineospora cianjurensis TaxID=585224 RepID=A0A421AX46_9PSEU|nr:condensation domain-containing protein [Actinokineospora cianjurensis]RLK54412.1 condensation domain-containing protein [Actinokineospora cianjurensis]
MTVGQSVATLPVRFRGARGGSGPVTLGQRNVLRWLGTDGDRSDVLPVFVELSPGHTVAEIVGALGVLVARHEALRTTFVLDSAGGPTQRVLVEGEVELQVYEAGGADLVGFVGQLVYQQLGVPFDVVAGLPLRVLVVTTDEVPTVAVLLFCHVAVDAAGAAIVGEQLRALLAGRDDLAEERGHQPLDQAEWEQSEVGRRRTRSALRYWDTRLRQVPQAMCALPPHPAGSPGNLERRMVSTAAASALRTIVGRTGASHSSVVLAAAAALLGVRTATPDGVIVSICGNRFRSAWREYVGPLAQDALVPFTLDGDATFDEVVRQVQTTTINAYRYAQFDSVELWEVIDAVGRERGTYFHRDAVFNDLGATSASAAVDAPEDPVAALEDTTIEPMPDRTLPTAFLLTLGGVSSTAADIRLHVDTSRFPADEVDSVLLSLERLLVTAATGAVRVRDIAAVTGVAPVERAEPWQRVDSSWVDPREVGAAVAEAAGGAAVRVAVEDGRITAVVSDPAATPAGLHAGVLAALPGRPGAMAPHDYVIHDIQGRVLESGSGRPTAAAD